MRMGPGPSDGGHAVMSDRIEVSRSRPIQAHTLGAGRGDDNCKVRPSSMTFQILLPLQTYPTGNSEALIPHALRLAQHLEGRIHALVHKTQFPQVSSALGNLLLDVPSLMAGVEATCRQKEAKLLAELGDQAVTAGVEVQSSEIKTFSATFGDLAAVSARFSDLTLIGLSNADSLLRTTAEAVVFGSGRPVVLLPELEDITGELDHVVIAWDGSRVAARAVSDARPFIDRASKVTIAVITDEKSLPANASGSRLAEYLALRGAQVELTETRSKGRSIAAELQEAAASLGGGVLVMGGFGHSRMRDFVLGGATRGIIEDLRMPVLLSH